MNWKSKVENFTIERWKIFKDVKFQFICSTNVNDDSICLVSHITKYYQDLSGKYMIILLPDLTVIDECSTLLYLDDPHKDEKGDIRFWSSIQDGTVRRLTNLCGAELLTNGEPIYSQDIKPTEKRRKFIAYRIRIALDFLADLSRIIESYTQ
jgi:hypothetical protein